MPRSYSLRKPKGARLNNWEAAYTAVLNNPTRTIPAATTLANLRARHEENSDVGTIAERVTLACPLSKTRIQCAAKSIACRHLQCFDLASFLRAQAKTPYWDCPICMESAKLDELRIDEFFNNILTSAAPDQLAIEILPDGLLRPIPPEEVPSMETINDESPYVAAAEDVKPDLLRLNDPPEEQQQKELLPRHSLSAVPNTNEASQENHEGEPLVEAHLRPTAPDAGVEPQATSSIKDAESPPTSVPKKRRKRKRVCLHVRSTKATRNRSRSTTQPAAPSDPSLPADEDTQAWESLCKKLGYKELPPPNLTRDADWEQSLWSVPMPKKAGHKAHHVPAIVPSEPTAPSVYDRCRPKATYLRQQAILRNWRTNKASARCQLRAHDAHVITCMEMSGDLIATGSDDGTVCIWLAGTAECIHTLRGHTGGVWTLQLSDDSAFVISGSTDRSLRVWCTASGELLHILSGHTSLPRCSALNKNLLVSGSRDCTVRLWYYRKGIHLRTYRGHRAAVRCVAFDGQRIVSAGYDYVLIVWNAARTEPLHILEGHVNRIYALLVNWVQNLVFSGSLDTTIRVWNAVTGECLLVLAGHTSLTSGLLLLEGNRLVSCNADATVRIWDLNTGKCVHTLIGRHVSTITGMAHIGYGLLATVSDDGTAKLWDVENGTYVTNLVRLRSAGKGGCVWRIRADATTLVCAVGSRNGLEDTKLMLVGYDAPYPQL